MPTPPEYDYCARCYARWLRLPVEERKTTTLPHARTSRNGTRLCGPCAEVEDREAS